LSEEAQHSTQPVLAILVGGRSSRMGVRAKGRLLSPLSLTPIVEHLITEGNLAGLEPVLVGKADDYIDLAPETDRIPDASGAEGPLAGVIAAAEYAAGRLLVLVGCDMPYVNADALRHLLRTHPKAAALAPRRDERWEPLFSRWESQTLATQAKHVAESDRSASLQRLFAEVETVTLGVDGPIERALHDWDSPDDREL